MSFILFYSIIIGGVQYWLAEEMQSLSQCRRILPIIESSEMVVSARCAAVIFDEEKK